METINLNQPTTLTRILIKAFSVYSNQPNINISKTLRNCNVFK